MRAFIFVSASLFFLRSRATTVSGAFATKRSLESFFSTPMRKPCRCFNSASAFSTSAATTTISGITAGDYGLWLDSKSIANGVSRTNVKLAASQSISLDAKGYAVYVKGKFDEEQPDKPEEYTPVLDKADEISFFFETPTETTYSTWAWDSNGHNGDYYMQNTTWPGDDMKLMGTTSDGKYIYKYTFTKVTDIPTSLIIS